MSVSTVAGITGSEFIAYTALAAASYGQNSAPLGWRSLVGQDLGLSASSFTGQFYTSGGAFGGAAARVMVSGDTLALSFRGTDGAVDVADYPRLVADPNAWLVGSSAYIWTYDVLLDAVADYVLDASNGIRNVVVAGHSLGGAAVNQLRAVATSSDEYGDAFDRAEFFAVASPVIFDDEGPILNFGHDNDVVFRAVNLYDDTNATATDNIVWYDSSYASGWRIGTAAHGLNGDGTTPGAYAQTAQRLVDYGVYGDAAVSPDSQIIIDAFAGAVTVADRNKAAVILGQAGIADTISGGTRADVIIGGGGADVLTGGAGADQFRFLTGAAYRGGVARIADLADDDMIRFVGLDLRAPVDGSGAGLGQGGVALQASGGDTLLLVGLDARAGADLTVRLTGAFDAADFRVAGDTLTVDLPGVAVASSGGSWWSSFTSWWS